MGWRASYLLILTKKLRRRQPTNTECSHTTRPKTEKASRPGVTTDTRPDGQTDRQTEQTKATQSRERHPMDVRYGWLDVRTYARIETRTILSFQFCYLVLVGKFKQTQRTLFFVGRLVGRVALVGLFAFAFFLCSPFGCLKRLNVVIFLLLFLVFNLFNSV